MEKDVEDFLEHHGVKGQKWGVSQKGLDRVSRIARGTARTARAVGRGVGKTAKNAGTFAKDHPKITGLTIAGAALTATMLSNSGSTPISSATIAPFSASGKGWLVEAQDGGTFDMLLKTMNKVGR